MTDYNKTTLTALYTELAALQANWSRIFAAEGEPTMSPIVKKLRSLERRLDFANGRLPLVRLLLERKAHQDNRTFRSAGVQACATLRLPPINERLPDDPEELKE